MDSQIRVLLGSIEWCTPGRERKREEEKSQGRDSWWEKENGKNKGGGGIMQHAEKWIDYVKDERERERERLKRD